MYLKLCGMHKIFLMVPLPFSCDCCVSTALILHYPALPYFASFFFAFFDRFLWMKLFLDTAHHYRTDMSGGYAMKLGLGTLRPAASTCCCCCCCCWHWCCCCACSSMLLLCHLLMDFVVWLTWNGIALMYWVECRASPTLHLSDFICETFKNETR